MDHSETKEVLRLYREGTDDDADPAFQEALANLASDPALAVWFRAEQEFDDAMVATFRKVPVNLGLKEEILQRARNSG